MRNRKTQGGVVSRTDDQWRASELGLAAMHANLEMKAIYSLARKAGIDLSPGGYVDELRAAHLAGYENARAAWCAGDGAAAARFVAYCAMCVGLAARDAAPIRREIAKIASDASKGKPRPARRLPVANALRALINEGLTNDQIFEELGSADNISKRALSGFPIEVCDPETSVIEDGFLRWYVTGGDSDKPKKWSLQKIRSTLSRLRNPPKRG